MSRSETREGRELNLQEILNPGGTQEQPPEQSEDTGQEVDESPEVEETEANAEVEETEVDENATEASEPDEGDTEQAEETSDDVEALKKELENYKNRYSNAEKLIGKHSQELHELRKFYQQQQQAPKQNQPVAPEDDADFLDSFVKNPKEALMKELQRRDEEINNQRMQQEQWIAQNTQHVYNSVTNFDELKNDILAVAKEDGIENPTMEMLNQTINTDPLLAIQYAKRAS